MTISLSLAGNFYVGETVAAERSTDGDPVTI